MTKKSFAGGLNTLLGEAKIPTAENTQTSTDGAGRTETSQVAQETETKPKKRMGRPRTSTRIITKSSQEGTKENETRATFIVREDLLAKIKAIAYWDRMQIKDVINQAMLTLINNYEQINGPIKPQPNTTEK